MSWSRSDKMTRKVSSSFVCYSVVQNVSQLVGDASEGGVGIVLVLLMTGREVGSGSGSIFRGQAEGSGLADVGSTGVFLNLSPSLARSACLSL